MKLTATFKSKGIEHTIFLNTEFPDRNYDDENYAEWFITAEDKRVLEVTVWKDARGAFTTDGTVEVYKDIAHFEDGDLLDKKSIKLSNQ